MEDNDLKKRIACVLAMAALTVGMLAGCETEASRVEYNLTQEADNFNIVRQLTVINCLQGDVLFQMTGSGLSSPVSPVRSTISVSREWVEYP